MTAETPKPRETGLLDKRGEPILRPVFQCGFATPILVSDPRQLKSGVPVTRHSSMRILRKEDER